MTDFAPSYRFAHIHGFSSSAASKKGVHLAREYRRRGRKLLLPDLNRPSFEEITFTKALEVIDEMDATYGQDVGWRISASSMGAYLTALWAAHNPERVDRLVLLCPAFDLVGRFPSLVGSRRMAQWEKEGTLRLPGPVDDEMRPVHWAFIEDARRYGTHPEVPCPTLIIHGRKDPTIPIASSRNYAKARDHVELVEVDDVHNLENSLDLLTDEIMTFFELS